MGDPDNPEKLTDAQRRYLSVKRAQQIEDIPGLGTVSILPDGPKVLTDESTITGGLEGRAEASERGKQDAITAAIPGRAEVTARTEAEQNLPQQSDEVARFSREGEEFIRKLESGELDTGFFIGQFPAVTTDAQLFEVFSGDQVLEKISSATFGALSEGEREFLRSTDRS